MAEITGKTNPQSPQRFMQDSSRRISKFVSKRISQLNIAPHALVHRPGDEEPFEKPNETQKRRSVRGLRKPGTTIESAARPPSQSHQCLLSSWLETRSSSGRTSIYGDKGEAGIEGNSEPLLPLESVHQSTPTSSLKAYRANEDSMSTVDTVMLFDPTPENESEAQHWRRPGRSPSPMTLGDAATYVQSLISVSSGRSYPGLDAMRKKASASECLPLCAPKNHNGNDASCCGTLMEGAQTHLQQTWDLAVRALPVNVRGLGAPTSRRLYSVASDEMSLRNAASGSDERGPSAPYPYASVLENKKSRKALGDRSTSKSVKESRARNPQTGREHASTTSREDQTAGSRGRGNGERSVATSSSRPHHQPSSGQSRPSTSSITSTAPRPPPRTSSKGFRKAGHAAGGHNLPSIEAALSPFAQIQHAAAVQRNKT